MIDLSKLKMAQIIALYNFVSLKPVTKFETRGKAIARTEKALGAEGNDLEAIEKWAAVTLWQVGPPEKPEAPERELGAPQGISINGGPTVEPAAVPEAPAAAPAPSPAPAPKKKAAAKPAPAKKAAPAVKKPAAAKEKKKQKPSPHINLRCKVCAYYAKTTVEMNTKARLRCPVDASHGKLLTAEERGEKRGR